MPNAIYNNNPSIIVQPNVCALSNYVFVSAGSSVLSGYFIDAYGAQLGALVTATITTQTTLTAFAGGTLPTGAVGFIGTLTGSSLYVGRGGNLLSIPTPASGYPVIVASNYVTFGLVI